MLIKSDMYLKQNYKELLENGSLDENPRPRYETDKQPAYTKFITQVFEKYDLSKGEYPFSLARKIAVKTGIKEILAIYQGQQNTRDNFKKYGVTWWESWFNKKGNLGKAYPYNLESHRPKDTKKEKVIVKQRLVSSNDIGNQADFFEIVKESNNSDLSNITLYTEKEIKYLRSIWINLTFDAGLYNETKKSYEAYIHKDWYDFRKFLIDLPYIPHFNLARESGFAGYVLSTEYYKSNCYSKETCVFLSHTENINTIDWNKANPDAKELIRNELSRNQVIELLKGLKEDPFGRRHIISFWNWANIDKKTLVECAYETLWSCRRGKDGEMYLDMTLIQR